MVVARFLIGGVLNTGITYLVYLGLLQVFSYQAAYTGAFVLGIAISYLLNAIFVFRAGMAVGTLIRFPMVYLVQYVVGLGLVAMLVELVDTPSWIAPVIAMLVTVPLTFVLARTIFSAKKNMEASSAS